MTKSGHDFPEDAADVLCGVAIEERNKVIYVSGRFARQRIQKAALGNGLCDSQELSGGL